MAPANNDTLLRFFDVCPAYEEYVQKIEDDLVRPEGCIQAHSRVHLVVTSS
jgi:hypothetical protein